MRRFDEDAAAERMMPSIDPPQSGGGCCSGAGDSSNTGSESCTSASGFEATPQNTLSIVGSMHHNLDVYK